jgi:hypothetical protein
MFTLEAGLNQIFTLSTIDTAAKGEYPDPPIPTDFPLPYMDNFNGMKCL